MLSFFYQRSPKAVDLRDMILSYAIARHDDDVSAIVAGLITAYLAAVEDEEGPEVELVSGQEAETLSARAYARTYGISLDELWSGNSGWTWPESLPYNGPIPKEIVIKVGKAIAERDRINGRALARHFAATEGAS